MKLSEKQIFILKAILGTTIALDAGGMLALRIDLGFWGTLSGALYFSLFPLLCLVIMQWILSSDYLPKWWFLAGLIGCGIATSMMIVTKYSIPGTIYQSHSLEMALLNSFLTGSLATLPQGVLMKSKHGYFWILANIVGWVLSTVYRIPQIHTFYPISSINLLRTLIMSTYNFPLGLMVGISLYNIKTKSNSKEGNK